MYRCPYCQADLQDFALRCHACDGDVQVLAMLIDLPNVQFNLALRAARGGDWFTAMNLLGGVLAIRPADVDAWVLLGTLHARQANRELARNCWSMALVLKRGEPRAMRGLQALASQASADPAPSPTN